MSTVIENGYEIPLSTFEELGVLRDKVQKEMNEVSLKIFHKELAKRIVRSIDDVSVMQLEDFNKKYFKDEEDLGKSGLLKSTMPFYNEYKRMLEEKEESDKKGLRSLSIDLDCEVVFFPTKNKTLALLYSEQKEFIEVWEKNPLVTYYGYWNNVDRDDNVTKEEWDERREDWEFVLPGIGIPSESGFVCQLTKGLPRIINVDKNKIIENIPTLEERIDLLTKESLLDEKCREIIEELDCGAYKASIYAMRWYESEDATEMIIERIKFYEKELLPKIKKEYLDMTFQDLLNIKA